MNARRVGAILLALCLLITCGHCAELGNSLAKVAKAAEAEPAEPGETGESEEPVTGEGSNLTEGSEDRTYDEYTLYNFVKVGDKYGRLRKTTIEVKNNASHYLSKDYKQGQRYPIPVDDFRFAEGAEADYNFSGEYFVYNNEKYAWSEDFDASDAKYADFAGYYVVKGTTDEYGVAAIKNKIGGTSLTGFQAYYYDEDEGYKAVSFNDKNADSFHRDYEIEFVSCKPQDLYNYAKIGDTYYRLGTVTKIGAQDINSVETGELADGTYRCKEYDFTNATLTVGGISYIFRDADYKPEDDDNYVPYYTVDFSETVVSKQDALADEEWYYTEAGWIEGVKWFDEEGNLLSYDTVAFHRDYTVTLHNVYTVNFYDGVNEIPLDVFKTEQLGVVSEYNGAEVTDITDEDAKSVAVFIGWNTFDDEGNATFYAKDADLAPVTGDQDYYAVYKTYYTVTFLDPNGEELQTGEVAEGEQPVFNEGKDPVSEDENEEFKGWKVYVADASEEENEPAEDGSSEEVLYTQESLPAVTASVTYMAVFEKNEEPGDEPGDEPQESNKKGNDITFYKGDKTVEPICVKDSVDDSQTYETFGSVKIDGQLVSHVNYDTKKGSLILTFDAAYLETVALGDHKVTMHFVGDAQEDVDVTLHVLSRNSGEEPSEEPATSKHEYYLAEGDNGVHVKNTSETLTFVFKCRGTETDETYHHFAAMNMDGVLVSTINYNAAEGSLLLTLTADYLESLSLGAHTLTAMFDDGDDVDAHFTIVEKTEEPATTDEPTEPAKTDEPTEPAKTDEPAEPAKTDEPAEPAKTDEPTEPAKTDEPAEPAKTEEPAEPAKTGEPAEPAKTEQKPVEVTPAKAEATTIPAKADSALTGGDSTTKVEPAKTEESSKTTVDVETKTNTTQKADNSGSTTGEGSTPKTGDTMGPVLLLALLAAVVMMTLVFWRKRSVQF